MESLLKSVTQNFIALLVFNLAFFFLFLVSEFLFKKFSNVKQNDEMLRKSSHFLAGLTFFSATYYLPQNLFIIICIEALISLIASKYLHILKATHETREKGNNLGIYFYILGILIAGLFFFSNVNYLRTAILVLSISDMLAAIIGNRLPIKRYTIVGSKKSIGGSLACFISSFFIVLFFANKDPLNSIFYAAFIAFIEASADKGSDNIQIMILVPLMLIFNIYQNILFFTIILGISLIYGKYNNYNQR